MFTPVKSKNWVSKTYKHTCTLVYVSHYSINKRSGVRYVSHDPILPGKIFTWTMERVCRVTSSVDPWMERGALIHIGIILSLIKITGHFHCIVL